MAAHLGASHLVGRAEVQELDLDFLCGRLLGGPADEDDVLELDVPMHDVEGMEVVEAAEQLPEDGLDDVFVEVLALLYEVDDRAAPAVLRYHLVTILALEHLVQLNDVRVVQLLQQLQLREHRRLLVLAKPLLFYDLDGAFLARLEAKGAVDAAEGAFAHNLFELVVSLYIFIAQLDELLLADLNPPLLGVHHLLGHHVVLYRRLELEHIGAVDAAALRHLLLPLQLGHHHRGLRGFPALLRLDAEVEVVGGADGLFVEVAVDKSLERSSAFFQKLLIARLLKLAAFPLLPRG